MGSSQDKTLVFEKSVVATCKSYIQRLLKDLEQKHAENANTIYQYLLAEQSEYNIKESTKESKIKLLVYLSRYFNNSKSFMDITKQDILEHMNSLRNNVNNNSNNNSKWIGTYTINKMY